MGLLVKISCGESRLKPAVEQRACKLADDEDQRMINILSAHLPLLAGHVFHKGVWRFLGTIKHLVVHCNCYPSLTLLQASQQTVKVVELPTPTPASTPLTLSTSIGDDVTKLLEQLLSIVLMTS